MHRPGQQARETYGEGMVSASLSNATVTVAHDVSELGFLASQVMNLEHCLLVARHGRTAWNAEDRLTTSTDIPLIDEGMLLPTSFIELGIQSFANAAEHARWLIEHGGRIITLDEVRARGGHREPHGAGAGCASAVRR